MPQLHVLLYEVVNRQCIIKGTGRDSEMAVRKLKIHELSSGGGWYRRHEVRKGQACKIKFADVRLSFVGSYVSSETCLSLPER